MRKILTALILLFVINTMANGQERLADDKHHNLYMQFWPNTTDAEFNNLKKRNVIFYTDIEMPRAYQDYNGLLTNVHSPSYNISASKPPNGPELFGNPNIEFPWGTPAGLHESKNFKTIRFMILPDNKKITYWQSKLKHDDNGASLQWQYPEGTVFGEILLVTDVSGHDHTFEVRTRKRKEVGWKVNVYRPYPTEESLRLELKELGITFSGSQDSGIKRLKARHPDLVAFDNSALVTTLPSFEHDTVIKLLEKPFESCFNVKWKPDANAPTSNDAFSIVPKHYMGTYINVNDKFCMNCHDSVQKHVNDFERFRDWYGQVRGSDNIFSFHIFDPKCISYTGTPIQTRLNPVLSNIIEPYNRLETNILKTNILQINTK